MTCNVRIGIRLSGLLLALGTLAGCQLIAFNTLMWSDKPMKDIKAEYPYLAKQRVAVLVRASMETQFEYPHVQWELADHLRVALEGNVSGVRVVDPRLIVELQRREPAWERMDLAEIGKKFGAKRLIEINLTQYTTREPDAAHIRRGNIGAAISVYNCDYPNSEPAYSTDVQTKFPPEGAGEWGASERTIRRQTMEAFAGDVARKFYDHKVEEVYGRN
jgi:hypothetical protein